MLVSECMLPRKLYNELVHATNNNTIGKYHTNTADVSIHVFVVLLRININILTLLENHRNNYIFRRGQTIAVVKTVSNYFISYQGKLLALWSIG